jgi:hypothetical protein
VFTVKRYWVFQFHVILEGVFIVNVKDRVVPDVGTLPVPVHPVHMYRVPAEPEKGEVMDKLMDFVASNHPLVCEGEP